MKTTTTTSAATRVATGGRERLTLSNSSVMGTCPASNSTLGLGKFVSGWTTGGGGFVSGMGHLLTEVTTLAYAVRGSESPNLLATGASWRGGILFREGCSRRLWRSTRPAAPAECRI